MHGFLLVGGEKMCKTSLNQIAPADLVADFGVDGYRYHFLGATPFGPDGDFSYEGMVERYNSDLANNLGNLQSRVATVVGKKCDGVGPAPRPDSPLAAVAAEAYAETAAAWERVQPSLALEATWRLIRETNALPRDQRAVEGRARPRGRRRARRRPRGPAHRDDPGLAGRARAPVRRSGAGSASTAGPTTSACPRPRPGAATPAASRSRRATRSSPA